MRKRPSARILLLDETGHLLLFRFVFKTGALAGEDFWATPGGALDEGETYLEAAHRELLEETGIQSVTMEGPIAEKEFVLTMSDGEKMLAQEQFFVVRAKRSLISDERWTELERDVMAGHRWWSIAELTATEDVFYPEDLATILSNL